MPATLHNSKLVQKLLSLLLAASLLPWTMFAQEGPEGPPPPPPQEEAQSSYTFRTTSDLVLVDVVARDKSGNLVRDLKQSDFSIVEDGKPQHLMSFDIERPEGESQTNVAQGYGQWSVAGDGAGSGKERADPYGR